MAQLRPRHAARPPQAHRAAPTIAGQAEAHLLTAQAEAEEAQAVTAAEAAAALVAEAVPEAEAEASAAAVEAAHAVEAEAAVADKSPSAPFRGSLLEKTINS